MTPGIRAIGCAFPRATRSLADLAAAGQLRSGTALLEEFGFGQVHVAETETPFELALAAAREALERGEAVPEDVDLVIYAGTPGVSAFVPSATAEGAAAALRTTARFKYPGARLQYELGLSRAALLGVDQLACTSLIAAVRIARALCLTEGLRSVLCVASEFFPADAGREAIYNCTSDAACAVLVQADAPRHRVLAATHVTKGYYWDCDALENEILASYFPTACHVIEHTIERAGWTPSDVDWVIPHNVSLRSWRILLGLAPLPNARLWDRNIAARGHTLAGDNFINLHDALEAGDVRPGHRLLLFSYGYGAHWTALAVEA